MASAFSSNDTDILNRENDVEEIQQATPLCDIEDVYEINRCVDFIKENSCETVALQFPDYLLVDAANIARVLQGKTSSKIFVLADTSYGSYDIDEVAAQHIQADLIIHYGRSALTPSPVTKTLFVFGRCGLNIDDLCNALCSSYPDNNANILLMLELPWLYATESIKSRISSIYQKLLIADVDEPELTSPKEDFCTKACPDCTCLADKLVQSNSSNLAADIDDTFCIGCYKINLPGDANFDDYSLFFVGKSQSETLQNILLPYPNMNGYVYDPVNKTCSKILLPVNRVLRKRFFIIEKVKDAKSVGILVGTMGMAGYREIIDHLKKILAACGKKTYIFVVGKLNPNKLANFPEIDVFVLVACPEETLIDQSDYFKPICTPFEVEMACNTNREWGNIYPLDFRQLLPGGKHYVEFKPRCGEGDLSLITGRVRQHVENDISTAGGEVEVRNMETSLNVFHPHSAARFYSERSWQGLEQKLGESPVQAAKEGRSGVPMFYTNGGVL